MHISPSTLLYGEVHACNKQMAKIKIEKMQRTKKTREQFNNTLMKIYVWSNALGIGLSWNSCPLR